ncbi:Cyclopropane-fatty-acyl-phospholipid synthase [Pseudovibrio axinellae]|uniref:Cyclopropane-fatty-acyl-phospholipid synthase n=1 Tax=Pseudovibrio axinellae TaxID=989403 RepID=A0A165XSL9_9HYPH|nr:cyclopropane-fatty-acyl-phospholipid synthase family protein [Pseudovibrio axinellae]KZL17998.1 Cyclopropane-fatty-acyl-phospholipid synthase [Pseudovibrio axinellae]SER14026.1 cyclopropane-fatty-acyl-phospholipid synthase [Pseudovibrio axinellae]
MRHRERASLHAPASSQKAKLNLSSKLWKALLDKVLTNLTLGHLCIILPNGQVLAYGNRTTLRPAVTVKILRARLLWRLVSGNSLTLAEAYLEKDWQCNNLRALFDLLLANKQILHSIKHRGFLSKALARLRHLANANTLAGSKRNIAFHYDLGNEFYGHWLDETMTYSSAYKLHKDETLQEAQRRKYQRVLQLTNTVSNSNILEIGCGWGGFAEHACHLGRHVHGITLSQEQLRYAQNRLHSQETTGAASFEMRDYRETFGQYDAIVSIEMIEAVGEENWQSYFQQLKSLLKPGGIAVIQAILISDGKFQDYRQNVDFIQRYIFPGGLLPSAHEIEKQTRRQNLELTTKELFGTDYEQTLIRWRTAFFKNWPAIAKLGYDQRFKRMWHYYLAYCEAGFAEGTINVGLFQIKKPL